MSLRGDLPSAAAAARRRVLLWGLAIVTAHVAAVAGLLVLAARVARRPFDAPGAAALALLTLAVAWVLRSFDPLATSTSRGGVVCTASAEPGLFACLGELAGRAGVPTPRRVLLVPGVTAHVAFDTLGRADDLVLGLGLVNALTRTELEAVIAHELRHAADAPTFAWRFAQAVASIPARRLLGGWVPGAEFALVDVAFAGFFRAYVAMRRQGELVADAAAVEARGSDAIVHALVRFELAEAALELAMAEAARLARDGAATDDLYVHQRAASAWLRERTGRHDWGVAPALPADPARRALAFRAESASPAWVWREHPEPFERERVAKDPYVRAPLDDRSAWTLFARPEALRARLTETWWRENTPGDPPPKATAASVQARLSAEWAAETPPDDPGAWPTPVRWLWPAGDAMAAPPVPSLDDAALAEATARLHAFDLRALARRHEVLTRDLVTLTAIARGQVPVEGGRFAWRGEEVSLTEIPKRVARLSDERLAVRRQWQAHDGLAYAVGVNLARRVDPDDEALLAWRWRFQVQLQAALDELDGAFPALGGALLGSFDTPWSSGERGLRNAWVVVEATRARLADVAVPPLDGADGQPLPALLLGAPLRPPEVVGDAQRPAWMAEFFANLLRARATGERLLARNLASLLGQQSALLRAHAEPAASP